MPTTQELLAIKKQQWNQQYDALKRRSDTNKVVVEQLSFLEGQQQLTDVQTRTLDAAKHNQLEAEYSWRQFLDSPRQFQSQIDTLNRRLQNDSSLSLFQRDQIERDIVFLNQQRNEFNTLWQDKGWSPPDYTYYTIGDKRYDNSGTPPRWDVGTQQGAFRDFLDTEILDPLKSFGNSIYETFRPFLGGATQQETYQACAALIDHIAGGKVSKVFRTPAPTSSDPMRQELYDHGQRGQLRVSF